jgi:murein L,D-transpeptidase YcbB/YkuD
MKLKFFLSFLLILSLFILGCVRKKQETSLSETEMPSMQSQIPEQLQTITITPAEEILPSMVPVLTEEEQKLLRNKQIQEALKLTGYYQGDIDGKVGPLTRKAIHEFQEAKGLVVDGKVGPKTWAELEKVLTAAQPVTTGHPALKNN